MAYRPEYRLRLYTTWGEDESPSVSYWYTLEDAHAAGAAALWDYSGVQFEVDFPGEW